VEALLNETQPEQVYHLAGYANAAQSHREAEAAWSGNLTATRCLYEAIHRSGFRTRILFVGSGLVYRMVGNAGQGLDEHSPLLPESPYASSKAAADLLSYQYTRTHKLDIIRVRPFNHIGPHQSTDYAVAHFARQIAAIERGLQAPLLETGNLNAQRDLTDVRDMVQAYLLLMEHGTVGEVYNAGTGKAYAMQAVVDRLLELAFVKIEVRQKQELVRPTDIILADARKLRALGWEPQYTLNQTLTDTLEYWRSVVNALSLSKE
jgi:GDP-4-dehydro-6-deoxy-D-mannose reductase